MSNSRLDIIKNAIAEQGMSKRQFAKKIGYSYPYLINVFSGKLPSNDRFVQTCENALGIDADTRIPRYTDVIPLTVRFTEEEYQLAMKNCPPGMTLEDWIRSNLLRRVSDDYRALLAAEQDAD